MSLPRFYQRWVEEAGVPPGPGEGALYATALEAYLLGAEAVLTFMEGARANHLVLAGFYAHGANDILAEVQAALSRGEPKPFEAALNAVIGASHVRKEEEEEDGRDGAPETPED